MLSIMLQHGWNSDFLHFNIAVAWLGLRVRLIKIKSDMQENMLLNIVVVCSRQQEEQWASYSLHLANGPIISWSSFINILSYTDILTWERGHHHFAKPLYFQFSTHNVMVVHSGRSAFLALFWGGHRSAEWDYCRRRARLVLPPQTCHPPEFQMMTSAICNNTKTPPSPCNAIKTNDCSSTNIINRSLWPQNVTFNLDIR